MVPVRQFLRRLQWRPAGSTDPEPVVALLGPPGSGKSTTLRALSTECGGTIVHARLDFAEHEDLDAVSAVAFIAFLLMRDWRNLRRRPTFHRLGLALLALNEQLERDRAAAQAQIRDLIGQYVDGQPMVRAGDRVVEPLFTAAEIASAFTNITLPNAAVRDRAKPVIAALVRRAERWRLRGALRWHHALPEAEDASTVDSLIALSTVHRGDALSYVTRALLADIEDFTRNHPPARSGCDCLIPPGAATGHHDHVWLLMLDHVESAVGDQVLQALATARQRRAGEEDGPAPDPLLVVAAAGRWRPAWGQWWREPWRTGAGDREPIPLFSSAERAQWLRHARQPVAPRTNPARAWYPVWLDPVPVDRLLGSDAGTELGVVVSRLASGHPGAAGDILTQTDASRTAAGDDQPAPTVLDARDDAGIPLWRRAVPGLLPDGGPWPTVPPPVVVAARLSEPGRAGDDLPAHRFPDAVQTLRELRGALWVSTFAARPSPLWPIGRGDEEHPATLHPWLSRSLLAGLAAEGADAWVDLFAGVYEIEPDPGRTLFRDLAQGRFGDVVKELAGLFDTVDHRAWVRALDDATSAPCRLPHREPFAVSYRRLAPDHVPGRTAVESAVTSVTALLWLYRDPLSVPGPLHGDVAKVPWHKQVRLGFEKLAHVSARSEVSALEEAASQFETLT